MGSVERMLPSRVLKDVGLALLAVVTVLAAGYVLLRDPSPAGARPFASSSPAPLSSLAAVSSPAALSSPTAAASPSTAVVDALFLRSPGTPGGHVAQAGRVLGWRLADASLAALPDDARLAEQEVVLVQAGAGDQDEVTQAVVRVRQASPRARLVVLAPLAGAQVGRQLGQAVEGARTTVLDPVVLGWVSQDDLAANGSLTAAGAESVGTKLVAALD